MSVLHALALVFREQALANPHLYDLMFGLTSQPSTKRPPLAGQRNAASSNYGCAFKHIVGISQRVVSLDRFSGSDAEWIGGQLWALVHGVVSLELSGLYGSSADAGREALASLIETYLVGAGDTKQSAAASRLAGASLFDSLR